MNEMVKGRILGAITTLDIQAGWVFNAHWNIRVSSNSIRKRTPSEADMITNEELKAEPFFKHFKSAALLDPSQGSSAANDYNIRADALAEAIPALSFAVGRNEVPVFEDRNIDLHTTRNGWPRASGRWLHGDLKDVAYRYNYPLWQQWVSLGGLK